LTKTAIYGTLLLFAVSLIVRIIPSFLRLSVSEETREDIKTTLPAAVFINLLVYCIAGEVGGDRIPAVISFLLLLVLLLVPKKIGLLAMVSIASTAFVLLKNGLPGGH
jgi:hypothetical protein